MDHPGGLLPGLHGIGEPERGEAAAVFGDRPCIRKRQPITTTMKTEAQIIQELQVLEKEYEVKLVCIRKAISDLMEPVKVSKKKTNGHNTLCVPRMENPPQPPEVPADRIMQEGGKVAQPPETPAVVGGGDEVRYKIEKIDYTATCPQCQKQFERRRKDQICCSSVCRQLYNHEMNRKKAQDEKLAKIRKEIPVKRERPEITRDL